VVAAVVTAGGEKESKADKAADKQIYADVVVEGDELATSPSDNDAKDPSAGSKLPTIAGSNIAGKPLTIAPTGGATVLVVFAHWCPHCQREVPRIVKHLDKDTLPAGVRVIGLSTAVKKGQPNFPPAKWLRTEKWPFPTLVDDEIGSAALALGVDSFPLLVFVDAKGQVESRFSGEMEMDELDRRIARISDTTAAA